MKGFKYMAESSTTDEQEFAVSLSPAYWTLVLASLEQTCTLSLAKLEEMRKLNLSPEMVDPPERTVLIGPLLARGTIIKAMTEHGYMSEEANKRMGIDTWLKIAGDHEAGKS